MFVGRKTELQLLEQSWNSPRGELVALYGRRRIGKSSLVEQFLQNKYNTLLLEGLEDTSTVNQIKHCQKHLGLQKKDPLMGHLQFSNWEDFLNYLTEQYLNHFSDQKPILFIDEIQWLAAGQGKLISLIKFFWDNYWKKKNVMLILCGSVASFMVMRVIRSKALYGRLTLEMRLQGLPPVDALRLFNGKRNKEEVLRYLLVLGNVPKYLEEVKLNQSFNKNINRLFFTPHGLLKDEIHRIFYSQFKEANNYLRIVKLLKEKLCTPSDISKQLSIASGGGLTSYLENLEMAGFITSHIPFGKGVRSKLKKYALADEFLIFYYKYVEPSIMLIENQQGTQLFENVSSKSFESWLGFAFERFCLKNASMLSKLMGFEESVLLASPYFERGDKAFQIDLLYQRSDNVVTVCEIKFHKHKVTTSVIPEMNKKIEKLTIPQGYSLEKALISLYGPDKSLLNAEYFDYIVTLDDILHS
ncbi:MAG: AAA family ATPase [Planctomycetes bacterium]|nr:AAA family ATPase [Planctomycetota bacterium]